MTHRAFTGAALVRRLALLLLSIAAVAAHAFSLDEVEVRARALAARPYQAPAQISGPLAALSYDDYRSIRFRPDHALWRDANLPFQLQFFHAGRGFRTPLELHEIDNGVARPLSIPRSDFDYGHAAHAVPAGGAADIAGFRVHYALNRPDVKDEVIVFLGASYFRAVGAGLSYGLSARALAVDTVGGSGEEFPAFTAFWIERPTPDATSLTIYGLLDGPRVTGAYRFELHPGRPTTIDVQSRVFLRATQADPASPGGLDALGGRAGSTRPSGHAIATLGIAPLTSMFLSGENQPDAGDFRPEVHDSDGLQVLAADGEWLWRPLVNPKQPFVTSFALTDPRGFGLLQRDRRFDSYEDLEARYEQRPSVWITPQGDWRAGRVELFQFHTPDETNDNVVAYWVPAQLPPPGQALALAYRMAWGGDELPHPPAAWVVQSRRGHGYHEGAMPDGRIEFNVDFAGPALAALPAETPVEAVVSAGDNGRVLQVNAYPHPLLHGWRMTLDLQRLDRTKPIELRAFLRNGPHILSETWSYCLPPE